MDLGEAGEKKIKGWEACARWINAIQRFVVYLDPAGKATIAWGHLLTAVELATGVFSKGLIQGECDALFLVDVQRYVNAVRAAIKVAVSQHAFDAMVCICYNIGTAGFATATFVRLINAGAPIEQIRVAWLMWDHREDPKTGKKVEDAGLKRRRLDELALFVDPDAIHDTPTEEERERQRGLVVVPSPQELANQRIALTDIVLRENDFGHRDLHDGSDPLDLRDEPTQPSTPVAKLS